jgi:hypothetical protein
MQIQSTTSSAAAAAIAQAQAQAAAQSKDAKEKFDTKLRGSRGFPTSSTSTTQTGRGRTVAAAFQYQQGPTILPPLQPSPAAASAAAAPAQGSFGASSAAQTPGAFASMSPDQANSIWYGGQDGGASVGGIYSEKASYGGMTGIGHPKFATVATGEDMVVSVTGLHGKNAQPTQIMALDSDAIMRVTGGVWPGTPAEMQQVLKAHPECIVANVQANPPQMARITGVPPGTKVTILTGAEGIMGNPPRTPPPSQAMITNISQLSPQAQALVPKEAIMAGGMEQMMKAQAEMAAKQAAAAAAERAAAETAQRFAMQTAANMAGSAAAESMGAQAQAASAFGSSSQVRGGGPPVPVSGPSRGAPTSGQQGDFSQFPDPLTDLMNNPSAGA